MVFIEINKYEFIVLLNIFRFLTKMIRSGRLVFPLLLCVGAAMAQRMPLSPADVVGNHTCRDCHEEMVERWEASRHSTSLADATSSVEAVAIADALGITPAEIPSHASCIRCHFTQEAISGTPQTTMAVSCESCHGGAAGWIEEHNRKSLDRGQRIANSHALGMAHPASVYEVAKTCFECHVIDDEQLVNGTGHPALSTGFELVSWYSGEVAHNFLIDQAGSSVKQHSPSLQPLSLERKRKLYLVGKLLHLAALTSRLACTEDAPVDKQGQFIRLGSGDYTFAVQLAREAKRIENDIADVLEFVPLPSFEKAYALSRSVRWETGRQAEMQNAAETLDRLARELSDQSEAASWSAIDPILAKLEARYSTE